MDEQVHLTGLVLHFNKQAPELTEPEVKQLIKLLLDSLRIQAKAKGWEYRIWVAYSLENLRSLERSNRHIHILLYYKGNKRGSKGIVEAIKRYWIPPTPKARTKADKPKPKRTRWGKVTERGVYNARGLLGYFEDQASFRMREQHTPQADIELPLEDLEAYEMSEEEYNSKYKMSEKMQTKKAL